jgi:entericidin B
MKEIFMRVLSLLVAAVIVLAGCNTVHGIGQDIEKGGEVIQKAATK